MTTPAEIALKLLQVDWLNRPTLAGWDFNENLVLRVCHALEAAGFADDSATDRVDGLCRFCQAPRNEPHDADCFIPQCVINGGQRLCCPDRGKSGHDCGASLWGDA
ncbi:hypothetical protein [Plantactinospora sp. WMMB782]|uniref:hypothetical protein n=1 Tax=Plantactinospora sp. WMMB782 TaxID=3404121 RepID=UPI003B947662